VLGHHASCFLRPPAPPPCSSHFRHCSPAADPSRFARRCAPARIRAATPVPSRLAAASTPRTRPVLSQRRCCALLTFAARPVQSHPKLAAFRGAPLPAHPVPSTVPSPRSALLSIRRRPLCPRPSLASTWPITNAKVLPSCPPLFTPHHARHTRAPTLALSSVPHTCLQDLLCYSKTPSRHSSLILGDSSLFCWLYGNFFSFSAG
jgi:hypothetical protein